jgi:hypothetical protein
MFSPMDGPTSLRQDMVWALAFSLRDSVVETTEGEGLAKAGMAAMWNGRKGEVVVLIRRIDPPAVARYRCTDPISSTSDLETAIDAALGFAETLGFMLDNAAFRELTEQEQRDRLETWDALRRVKRKSRSSDGSSRKQPESEAAPMVPPPTTSSETAPSRTAQDTPGGDEVQEGQAVLGKIALVRKGGAGARSIDPLGRLLSFF